MCNTLNKENKMNNQINGLSPNYKNIELYMELVKLILMKMKYMLKDVDNNGSMGKTLRQRLRM